MYSSKSFRGMDESRRGLQLLRERADHLIELVALQGPVASADQGDDLQAVQEPARRVVRHEGLARPSPGNPYNVAGLRLLVEDAGGAGGGQVYQGFRLPHRGGDDHAAGQAESGGDLPRQLRVILQGIADCDLDDPPLARLRKKHGDGGPRYFHPPGNLFLLQPLLIIHAGNPDNALKVVHVYHPPRSASMYVRYRPYLSR
jgi:hypothetical protein